MELKDIPQGILKKVRKGVVIPAHPLALDENRDLDEKYQRALTRYYIDAGAGGIAVGVHTTQFEIRNPDIDLFRPVLQMASETVDTYGEGKEILKVAGICGLTPQAKEEAAFAVENGYHAGLLSLSAYASSSIKKIIRHCKAIANTIPLVGFYLQPAVGGRILPYEFWREFCEIENVLAIKIAPFNRYQTLDVVRAVCESGRSGEIALYTGNDDNILVDLLTEYFIPTEKGVQSARIVGGLLGHWAVWTQKAVELLDEVHKLVGQNQPLDPSLLTLAVEITDSNAAFFDAANSFEGCIAGIHEVLRRQGLLQGTWCLNPHEKLSPGQSAEIDRVYDYYPHLNDDEFVAENLEKWLE